MSDDHIKYVRRENIDTSKWDRCIEESLNGLIYANSAYLDNMAKNWDAFISGDYEAVMPLTWNIKWGIKYLYQPPLCPQLGVFSSQKISEELIKCFIEQVDKHFKFAEIFFNYANYHPAFKTHQNYVLDLNRSYDDLSGKFKNVLRKNLKRASRFEFIYTANYNLDQALLIHQEEYQDRTPHVRNTDYTNFQRLCHILQKNNELLIRAAMDAEKDVACIAVLLIKQRRIYLIETTTTNNGRQMQANHFLMDRIIQEFCGKNLILDFVGSDIPGIALFYQNFSPDEQPYFFYRRNKLPWPINILKK